ncbi:Conserved_hypothetical protein [Hexamita inflata]|uniref:Uncharacterized protein n=1 Tax=Hexamita inflata TaxID=28002 RepID=A0AA86TB78_9EUKA|nr:Conserved hypothetical protein [Hexamita inflata]
MLVVVLCELLTSEKQQLYNCFDSNANINAYVDTNLIYVQLTSNLLPECIIPHGIKVTLLLDGFGSYVPHAFLTDFDYQSPQLIEIECKNAICSDLYKISTGKIIVESKNRFTEVPAGSLQVSRGNDGDCFDKTRNSVELYQNYVVFNLYATHACVSILSTAGSMNSVSTGRAYITYDDSTKSKHESLVLSVLSAAFIPDSDTPVRLKAAQDGISALFLAKGFIDFQLNLDFTIQPDPLGALIKKSVETRSKIFNFMGITNAYTDSGLQIQSNGILITTQLGPSAAASNAFLQSNNQNKVSLRVTFYITNSTKNIVTVQTQINKPFTFTAGVTWFTCDELIITDCQNTLKYLDGLTVDQVTAVLDYFFYSNAVFFSNMSVQIHLVTDSCFSDSLGDYTGSQLTLTIYVDKAAKYCALSYREEVTVKILNKNTGLLLGSQLIVYQQNNMSIIFKNVDIDNNPALQLDFYVNNVIKDSIVTSDYVQRIDARVTQQTITIMCAVLGANLGVTLIYCGVLFFAVPVWKTRNGKKQIQKLSDLKQIHADQEID